MKKLLIVALAALAAVAVTAVAVAQYQVPPVQFEGSVSPTKAGTKKKPRAAGLKLSFTIPQNARATADQIVFNLPRNVLVSGSGFPTCPASELNTEKDPTKCPKRSKIGTGTAKAFARGAPVTFNIQLFVASRNELAVWLSATSLGINTAIPATINRAGSPYGQKVTINIPEQLQQPVRGLFVYLTGLSANIKGNNGRKGKRRRDLVRTNGCGPGRRHRFQVRVRFVPNPNPPQGTNPVIQGDNSNCRR